MTIKGEKEGISGWPNSHLAIARLGKLTVVSAIITELAKLPIIAKVEVGNTVRTNTAVVEEDPVRRLAALRDLQTFGAAFYP